MRDNTVFDGKSLKELFRDIYDNQAAKKKEIRDLIVQLAKQITSPDTAVIVGPIIQSFMETAVKNDEHLIKMAMVVQRLIASDTRAESDPDANLLTDDEKATLVKNALHDLHASIAEVEDDIEINKSKV